MAARILPPLLIALLVFANTWQPLDGASDFWSHAAVGRWIVQNHQIPRHTLFLWTSHEDWVAHSWLSEIVCYFAMLVGGAVAGPYIAIFSTTLIAIAITLWAAGYLGPVKRQNPLFFLMVVLCVEAASDRFLPRPEIMSAVLFVALLTLLQRLNSLLLNHQTDRKSLTQLLLLFPAIMVLWVNCHGGMIVGLITIVVSLLAMAAQYRHTLFSGALILTAACCAVATLINPYGTHYYSIYSQVNTAMFKSIQEWCPFWQPAPMDPFLVASAFLVFLAAIYSIVRSERRPIWQAIVLLLMFILFLQARRNILFLSLTSLYIVRVSGAFALPDGAPWTSLTSSWRTGSASRNLSPAVVGAALLAVACAYAYGFSLALPRLSWPLQALASYNLPVHQADYVLKMMPQGHIFNDYDTAAYLEWRFGGTPELAVDSLNAYPESVIDMYDHVLDAKPDGLQYLDDNNVDCILGRGRIAAESGYPALYDHLVNDPQWMITQFPNEGPIWYRSGAKLHP